MTRVWVFRSLSGRRHPSSPIGKFNPEKLTQVARRVTLRPPHEGPAMPAWLRGNPRVRVETFALRKRSRNFGQNRRALPPPDQRRSCAWRNPNSPCCSSRTKLTGSFPKISGGHSPPGSSKIGALLSGVLCTLSACGHWSKLLSSSVRAEAEV